MKFFLYLLALPVAVPLLIIAVPVFFTIAVLGTSASEVSAQ